MVKSTLEGLSVLECKIPLIDFLSFVIQKSIVEVNSFGTKFSK